MTFTGRTPKDEIVRQIREAFDRWNARKASMTTLLGHYISTQRTNANIGNMSLPECAAAVVANPQEGIYA